MRTLVVYESMYGNTEEIARAIADGIGEADVVEVGKAPRTLPDDLELLVVGGPTHAHGLSSERSRRDAATRVDRPVISTAGIRDYITALHPGHAIEAAAFDTRMPGPKVLTGSAAGGASKALKRQGFRIAAHPESFVLASIKGEPFDKISTDEAERARAWGRKLTTSLD